jgi:hypothetical protein
MAPVMHYSLYVIITDGTLYTYLFYFRRIFHVPEKVTRFRGIAGAAILLRLIINYAVGEEKIMYLFPHR